MEQVPVPAAAPGAGLRLQPEEPGRSHLTATGPKGTARDSPPR